MNRCVGCGRALRNNDSAWCAICLGDEIPGTLSVLAGIGLVFLAALLVCYLAFG